MKKKDKKDRFGYGSDKGLSVVKKSDEKDKVKKSDLITIIGGEEVTKDYIESLYNDHVKNK